MLETSQAVRGFTALTRGAFAADVVNALLPRFTLLSIAEVCLIEKSESHHWFYRRRLAAKQEKQEGEAKQTTKLLSK